MSRQSSSYGGPFDLLTKVSLNASNLPLFRGRRHESLNSRDQHSGQKTPTTSGSTSSSKVRGELAFPAFTVLARLAALDAHQRAIESRLVWVLPRWASESSTQRAPPAL